jgi:hypothetical protein
MEDRNVELCLCQGGIRFLVTIPSIVADKMGELSNQEPEKWRNRDVELLLEAERVIENQRGDSFCRRDS